MPSFRIMLRSLARSPGFTLIAVATLALGLGANTAIFSAVYPLLIRPLPFTDSERLVAVRTMVKRGGWERRSFSLPDFRDYRAQATGCFDAFVGHYHGGSYNLTGGNEAVRVSAGLVSHDYFAVLGARPARGRTFTAEEDAVPDKHFVALISDALWRSHFGADANILNRTILLNGRSHTIVGVMPADFEAPGPSPQLWLPLALAGSGDWNNRGARWHEVIARLRPGLGAAQARAELATIGHRLAEAYPQTNTHYSADLVSLRDELFGDLRQPLLVLFGAVALVLAITCANVASILLARVSDRQREIAIRASLGADRGTLTRLFLAETAVLALLGGLGGLLVAVWFVDLLATLTPVDLPAHSQPALHWPVFLFTAVLALLCAFAIGVLPARLAAKTDLCAALQRNALHFGSLSGTRLRAGLIVAQMALSLALLTASVLMIRSFTRLVGQSPGYRTERSLALRVNLPAVSYPTPDSALRFARQLRGRAAALPGVEAAALGSDMPLDDDYSATILTIEGQPAAPLGAEPRAFWHIVSREFFATTGIPLLQGETFAPELPPGSEPVAIVSESFARRHWPEGDALGRRFKRLRADSSHPWLRVVGIVADSKYRSLTGPHSRDPDFFVAFDQRPTRSLTLLVHTSGANAALLSDLRAIVADLDAGVPVFDVTTIEERVGRASARQRFSATLMTGFAATALLLAALGLYGVVAFAAAARTREFGVRLALGARPGDIFRLVLNGAGRLVVIGVGFGLLLTLGLTHLISGLLYEVPPHDPFTYLAAIGVLGAVGLLAAWLPARRATKADSLAALRAE